MQMSQMHWKPENNDLEFLLEDAVRYLSGYRFNMALETLYVYLKNTRFSDQGKEETACRLKSLCRVFFDMETDV